jgi:hypothetical protein
MGDVQQVACTPSGECKFLFTNTINGKNGFVRLPAGPTPPMQVGTAGFGFQVVAADGVTVLLDVPETGFVAPAVAFAQLKPQAAAPAGITEGAIWYSSVDHQYHGLNDQGDCVLG